MLFRNQYWFLSNMSKSPMKINGLSFTCVEAAFQSFKTIDKAERAKFQNISGFEAKKLGRNVKLRPDWDDVKLEIMTRLIEIKFKNPELLKKLLAVNEEIVEDNNWNDKFWGKCNGQGRNELGKILMKVRDSHIN